MAPELRGRLRGPAGICHGLHVNTSDPSPGYIDVAVPVRVGHDVLTYALPQSFREQARIGCRVFVPVRRRRVVGVIVAYAEKPTDFSPRLIEDVIDPAPVIDASQLELCKFMSDYYACTLGEALRVCLPPDTPRAAERTYFLTEKGMRGQVFGTGMGLSKKQQQLLLSFEADQHKPAKKIKASMLIELVEEGYLQEYKKPPVKAHTRKRLELRTDGEPISNRAHTLLAFDAFLRATPGPHYVDELGIAFKDPAGKAKRLATLGRIDIEEEPRGARRRSNTLHARRPVELNGDQKTVIETILAERRESYLLEGVTGSGKTEVYLQILKKCIDENLGALFIVPEIALTPQLYSRMCSAVPDEEVVLLHSSLSLAERRDAWQRIQQGYARIVLGARSAIFAPVINLGLIVVDEEHDASLKQDETPRYHARDIALWRAMKSEATCILGSATPSLESVENTHRKKLRHLMLPKRAADQPMPVITLIDMREDKSDAKSHAKLRDGKQGSRDTEILSDDMRAAMTTRLSRGEQVLLFVNRRGYSTVIFCGTCGHIEQCPNCSVTLTAHKDALELRCHQCDHRAPEPAACKTCLSPLSPLGFGTERVEEAVSTYFPDAKVARLDRDTVRSHDKLRHMLRQIQDRKVDVIIGTQMVAKGHDFPGISLVGVLLADIALSLPDFRAAERTAALLTQVSGRAGRGKQAGDVLIQTYQPEHPAIRAVAESAQDVFRSRELVVRSDAFYPPFSKMVLFRIEADTLHLANVWAESTCTKVAQLCRDAEKELAKSERWDVLGPATAPLEKLRGRFRVQILVRTSSASRRTWILNRFQADKDFHRSLRSADVRLVLDVDPAHML